MASRLTRTLLFLVCIGAAAACSSTPEIPDDAGEKTYTYNSTEEDTEGATGETTSSDSPVVAPASSNGLTAVGDVAVVNGKNISADAFNEFVAKRVPPGTPIPPDQLPAIKAQIIDALVSEHLLKAAVDESGIVVTPEEIEAKLEELRQQYAQLQKMGQVPPQMGFEDLLVNMGVDPKNPGEALGTAVGLEKLLEQNGYKAPTDEDAKAFYEGNQQNFQQPAQVRARHILLKVDDPSSDKQWEQAKAEAEQIYREATKEGTDFAELAKARSQGPSASQGGDLGFFAEGQMVAPFSDAAFAMADGEISKPVRTRFGWHVIKREGSREAGPIPFDDVKELLMQQLALERFNTALQGYATKLAQSATIETKPENIN